MSQRIMWSYKCDNCGDEVSFGTGMALERCPAGWSHVMIAREDNVASGSDYCPACTEVMTGVTEGSIQ